MQPYNVNPRLHGINGFGLTPCDFSVAVKFDGSATASYVVPGDLPAGQMGMIGTINPTGNAAQAPVGRNKYLARFQYGIKTPGDVYVSVNVTAVLPSTNNFVKEVGELFPTAYEVFTGDTIYANCGTANQNMSISFWQLTS